jgi:hypothetical protein
MGARVTPMSGFSVRGGAAGRGHGLARVTTGAVLIGGADVGGAGAGGGGGGALAGVGWVLLGVGCALVGAGLALVGGFGATVVVSSPPGAGLRDSSRTPDTTAAAAAAAMSAVIACLLRYHGSGAGLNVNVVRVGEPSRP